MLGFFNKKIQIEVKAPVKGDIVSMDRVPDEIFSNRMLGDGIAIEPQEGVLVSPVEGEIVQVFPTKHAIGITSTEGLEILIHIGLDTVKMRGEGFESFVNVGDKVSVGSLLLKFDLEKIKQNSKSAVIPVVITNMEEVDSLKPTTSTSVQKGEDTIIFVNKKR